MSILRPYQLDLYARSEQTLAHLAHENPTQKPVVINVLPTGGGKTKTMTEQIEDFNGPQAAIAHRAELVGQISRDLARRGIRHGVIGADSTVRMIRDSHLDEFGRNFVDQRAEIKACSVDTLIRLPESDPWIARVQRWHGDEGHHFLAANKWGKAVTRMTNAQGVLWTATPCRADKRGLGRHADGLADEMILGPTMRPMINDGYLTDYRLIAPPVQDLQLADVAIGSTGDYVFESLRTAIKKSSRLVGNSVQAWFDFAYGKRTLVFTVDIDEAIKTADEFKRRGVRAEVVTGKTPDALRRKIVREFETGELMVLVNVDLFGEGFDVPAVECVIMARPTWSFTIYSQQAGRAVRLLVPDEYGRWWDSYTAIERRAIIAASTKPAGIIIDMTGNFIRNHLPDWAGHALGWTLDRQATRSSGAADAIPLRVCGNVQCLQPYEAHLKICPHCKSVYKPAARENIEQVEGDIFELTPAALAAMRDQVDGNLTMPKMPFGADYQIRAGIQNRFAEKVDTVAKLRDAMALWCAWCNIRDGGKLDNSEQARAFYFTFGIDVLTAQSLDRARAQKLLDRVAGALSIDGVTPAPL